MASASVHTGFWTDHTRGKVLGATLTLETRLGTQLISAAAIAVQIIGFFFFAIIAFCIHQSRARRCINDEGSAQVQVVLRNSSGPQNVLCNIFKVGNAARARKARIPISAVTVAIITALVYLGFLVAGVFVGQIATPSYNRPCVLMKPGNCGYLYFPDTRDGLRTWNSIAMNTSEIAKQYARQCYSGLGTWGSTISCSVYPVPQLEYDIFYNDKPCPIPDPAACFPEGDNGAPITLRTKPLDSLGDMGMNAPKEDRMTLQLEATCAPLTYSFVDGFISRSSGQNGSEVDQYLLGPLRTWGEVLGTPETFSYDPVIREAGRGTVGYSMNALMSFAPHNGNWSNLYGWSPTPPFNQVEGDLSLFALQSNGVTFSEAVRDPMFRTRERADTKASRMAPYVPERDAYMLACSEKAQICSVRNSSQCTGWLSAFHLKEVEHYVSHWRLTNQQAATFRLMASLGTSTMMFDAVNMPDPLLASSYLFTNTESLALPDNQWQREVEGWFQLVLARYQYYQTMFIDLPVAALASGGVEFVPAKTLGDAMTNFCHQQRIAAPQGYQSYNVFALALIACMGIIVPVTAVMLKKWYHKLRWVDPQGHASLTYRAEEMLQLHRMAMEAAGWTSEAKQMPQVVEDHDEDRDRPTLRYVRSMSVFESQDGDSTSESLESGVSKALPKDVWS